MLNEIEKACLEFLTSKLIAVRGAAIQRDTRGLLVNPALSVGCLEGSFERDAKAWKQNVTVTILLECKHAKGESERKAMANPLVEAIVLLLLEQQLGLKITKLVPVRWREVTDEDAYEAGKNQYLIQFATSFTIEKLEDEEAEDLLGIALDLLTQPGGNQVHVAAENPAT